MTRRIHAFGIQLDPLTMDGAIKEILGWLKTTRYDCKYIVTPNVDHIVQLQGNDQFLKAYHESSMVLIDGKPVVGALRLLGYTVPGTVTGSDLVPNLFSSGPDDNDFTVYLLGSASGVAERAADKIEQLWDRVKVVGCYSPPFGFENDVEENKKIIARINEHRPDILVIGLGAPKQELWINSHKNQVQARVALCVGATIDFFAGEQQRAPKWMQKFAIEWLYRMLTNPKRLVLRYVKDAVIFPGIVWREWMNLRKREEQ